MSRKKLGTLLTGLTLLLMAGKASAQPASEVTDRVVPPASLAGEFYLGVHVGNSFIGDTDRFCECDTDTNDFLLFGGRVGYYFTDHLAVEATKQWLNPDRYHEFWELTVGALWNFTPRIPGWNTYGAVGGGASREEVFKGRGIPIAYLAFGSEYRFNKLTGLRLELKGQYNFEGTLSDRFGRFDTDSRTDIQPNVGLLFHFGGKPAPVVVEPPAPPPPPPPAPPAEPPAPAPPPAPPVVPPPPPSLPPTTDEIDFDKGSARLDNIAKAKLDSIALRLRENPRATVLVTGHPDAATGPRRRELAGARVESVKTYLIQRHGIDSSRVTTEVDLTNTLYWGKAVVVVTYQPNR